MSDRDPVVAIHAQLLPGRAGGIETNLLGLVSALGTAAAGQQVLIGPGGESPWLEAYCSANQSVLAWPVVHAGAPLRANGAPGLRERGRSWLSRLARYSSMPRGDGVGAATRDAVEPLTDTLRKMGVALIHFPFQRFFPTSLPTIFEPWDLQHRHLPEFFTPEEIAYRDDVYQEGCRRAALVVTATSWAKRDLVSRFGIPPAKVAVIRRGATQGADKKPAIEVRSASAPLHLPEHFILYPAKTWPHKNHLRLFQALAFIRERHGVDISVVCTGGQIDAHRAAMEDAIRDLGLGQTVHFTGHLTDDQLAAVFSRAVFLVFPSLFEGFGYPLLEAMQRGLPIVTSRAACLPEVAGDAALYFDAHDPASIADAVYGAWSDRPALDAYRRRGAARIGMFDWGIAAQHFLACYRCLTGQGRTARDERTFREVTQS